MPKVHVSKKEMFELHRQAYIPASKLLAKLPGFWVNYTKPNARDLKLYTLQDNARFDVMSLIPVRCYQNKKTLQIKSPEKYFKQSFAIPARSVLLSFANNL